MAKKTKTREITIEEDKGTFSTLFKKFSGEKEDYNFEGLSALRHLLSNEKARMINVIKNKDPISIYDLAKKLGRDFKSVNDDIKLLERFGFIDLIQEKTGKRNRLKPVIVVDSIYLQIKL
tara:strand:+ start:1286 stop:1645 length:360 start_codon:yes stop_codon:yes gene_type:complete